VQSAHAKSNQLPEQKKKTDDITPSLASPNSFTTEELTAPSSLDSGFDYDEESILIQIPCPGLNVRNLISSDGTASVRGTARTHTRRLVPGFCTICLSAFEVGHDIVWSSNSKCDHCFHADCMQQWLTKQQRSVNAEGPVCPCCRRDFVVDPYDLMTVQSPFTEDESGRKSCASVPNSPVDTDESSLTCPLGDDERTTSSP
jgi:Ring finger domain